MMLFYVIYLLAVAECGCAVSHTQITIDHCRSQIDTTGRQCYLFI